MAYYPMTTKTIIQNMENPHPNQWGMFCICKDCRDKRGDKGMKKKINQGEEHLEIRDCMNTKQIIQNMKKEFRDKIVSDCGEWWIDEGSPGDFYLNEEAVIDFMNKSITALLKAFAEEVIGDTPDLFKQRLKLKELLSSLEE